MKQKDKHPERFHSISELHKVLGLPKPLHPLISLVENSQIKADKGDLPPLFLFNFYKLSFFDGNSGKMKYGQQFYDFQEGNLVFTAPNQLMSVTEETEYVGWTLLFHPEFIRNYPLGKTIKHYNFFAYSTIEALHLSESEKSIVLSIIKNIDLELKTNIDDFSQDVLVSQIELLLNYSNRFYKRQFITRKAANNDLLMKLEELLDGYFDNGTALEKGLPKVKLIADELNVSPHYLSDMLRTLTGKSAQQHIHDKLIEKAKEALSTSRLSIAEISYELGFEHPQSFHKFFKSKTDLSPLEYRHSFN